MAIPDGMTMDTAKTRFPKGLSFVVTNEVSGIAVRGFHTLRHIAIAVINLVDLLERVQCRGLVAHVVVDQSLFVKNLLLRAVHRVKVGEGVAELFDGKVEHVLRTEGSP